VPANKVDAVQKYAKVSSMGAEQRRKFHFSGLGFLFSRLKEGI